MTRWHKVVANALVIVVCRPALATATSSCDPPLVSVPAGRDGGWSTPVAAFAFPVLLQVFPQRHLGPGDGGRCRQVQQSVCSPVLDQRRQVCDQLVVERPSGARWR